MACNTFSCCPLIHRRLRSTKDGPAWRTISATSRGGRFMRSGAALLVDGASTHPVDWLLRRGVGSKDVDRSSFLPGRDDRATPESSGGRRLLPVDESRSSVEAYEDGCACVPGRHVVRPDGRRARFRSARWDQGRCAIGCRETASPWACDEA